MRSFGELSKPVLVLEVMGIFLLALAMLSINRWGVMPAVLSGKGPATLMFFTGIVLMLPAAITLMWRTAQALAPELFGRAKRGKNNPQSGDSHDADH
ncbi:hypothetical protein ED28_10575 [[Pantoea] beijingensis]|uniref:DUF1418 family protein n=1 Tax=[Pantoea] beijingensis TaxID=1324864 RepID=A0A443ICY5_9GAMM|nr:MULTISPECIES: YbjC family protein [Erwiniaceae]RWR02068.1 hypothetical protein ED28_10575 [[Pantoea] beijingensis]